MSAVADDVSRYLSSLPRGLGRAVPHDALGFYALESRGLPVRIALEAAESLDISRAQLASLLRISESTLLRRIQEDANLRGAEVDALYRVLGVLGVAHRVLKSRENVISWMSRPQSGLDGRTPLDLIGSNAGAEAVRLLLEQIYHGLLP